MGLPGWDAALLHWITDHPLPGSIPLFQFVSDATTPMSIGVVVVFFAMAALKRSRRWFARAITLAVVLLLVLCVSQGMKQLFDRERPFIAHPTIEKLSTGGDSSFPSGHTQEAFSLAATLMLLFRSRPLTLVAFSWAITVGYSRILLGVHYPSDVIAGALLGLFSGWLGLLLMRRFNLLPNAAQNG